MRVTDNGVPAQSATAGFTVQVNEANAAPTLAAIANRSVSEGQLLSVTNVASDTDTPAQSLTFSLDNGAPAGMTINPASGLITGRPPKRRAGQLSGHRACDRQRRTARQRDAVVHSHRL